MISKNGAYTYYALQHKTIAVSPWLQPNEPLQYKEDKWHFSNWDIFGDTAEPWEGKGNDYKPKYREPYEETHEVWAATGCHGWWTLENAQKGLKRVRQADTEGKFDYKDSYNNKTQAVRHEFRLICIMVMQQTYVVEELPINERETSLASV